MCAIFGIGLLRNHDIDYTVISGVVTRLAHAAQACGRDATGLAFTTEKEISIFKHNVKAANFTQLPEYGLELKRFLTEKDDENRLVSILGHCRHKTKGTEKNPLNNHPIETGNIVGVHNGVISNDDNLFNKYRHSIGRRAQVDSEIIFALIDYFSKINIRNANEYNPTTKALQDATDVFTGSLACAMVDARTPNNIWIWRRHNPVDVRYFKKEGLFIWATRAEMIRSSIEFTELSDPETIDIPYKEGICFNVESGTYYRFSVDKTDSFAFEHNWGMGFAFEHNWGME
jgi:glucosamine 6-phosphate synthetase-like amidotransferase/phosphosugar isomerase protein